MMNYEPLHYRYVGVENAKYMKEHDMCLEEYIDYLKQAIDLNFLVNLSQDTIMLKVSDVQAIEKALNDKKRWINKRTYRKINSFFSFSSIVFFIYYSSIYLITY